MTTCYAENGVFVGCSIMEYVILRKMIEGDVMNVILPLDVLEGFYKMKDFLRQANVTITWDNDERRAQ